MKTKFYIFISILIGIQSWAQSTAPDEIDIKMESTIGASSDREVDRSWINEDTKPLVIEKLLNIIKNDSSRREFAEIGLVELGHAETIERLVGEMLRGERPYALNYSTGETIPYLMKGLEIAPVPDAKLTDYDFRFGPVRDQIAASALRAVWDREKSFSAATRQWAKSMGGNLGPHQNNARIDLLKQWWEHNKAAILEKRYADATWLPMYKGKPSYLSDEEIKDRREKSQANPAPQNPPSIQATAPNAEIIAKKTNATEPSSKPLGKTLWIAFAAIITLLAGIIGRKIKAGKEGRE